MAPDIPRPALWQRYGRIVDIAVKAGVRDVVFGGQGATEDVALLGPAHYVQNLRDLGSFLQTRTATVASG